MLLRKNFRGIDIACRIGGDEFAIVTRSSQSEIDGLPSTRSALHDDELVVVTEGEPFYGLSAPTPNSPSRPKFVDPGECAQA